MMTFFLLLSSAFAVQLWTIPKMNCQNCVDDIANTASQMKGITILQSSMLTQKLCFTSNNPQAFLTTLQKKGYKITKQSQPESCPKAHKHPWAGAQGDVGFISKGEKVSLKKHLVKGKFTIIDFGATWCGPCYDFAKQLQAEMKNRSDIALRAVDLDAPASKAFNLPVAKQHLAFASGIPWMILYSPTGKKLYEGASIDKLLHKLRKKSK